MLPPCGEFGFDDFDVPAGEGNCDLIIFLILGSDKFLRVRFIKFDISPFLFFYLFKG